MFRSSMMAMGAETWAKSIILARSVFARCLSLKGCSGPGRACWLRLLQALGMLMCTPGSHIRMPLSSANVAAHDVPFVRHACQMHCPSLLSGATAFGLQAFKDYHMLSSRYLQNAHIYRNKSWPSRHAGSSNVPTMMFPFSFSPYVLLISQADFQSNW